MTYAIIETGGKQYKAKAGEIFDIERLETEEGKTVKFDKILLMGDSTSVTVGKPYVKGAHVEAEVIKNLRDKKVISFKYIRREGGQQTKIGHRQSKTRVRILSIKKG